MSEPEDDDDRLLAALGARVREEDAALAGLDDDALRPPDPSEADAMFAAAFGAVSDAAAEPAEAAEPESAAPLRFPTERTRRPWIAGAAVAAAAAAVLAVFALRASPTLPDYALSAGAGEQPQRSEPTPSTRARYSAGARLHLLARPAKDVAEPVTASLFVRQGGHDTRVDAALQISPKGAVRLDAVVGQSLRLPPGESTLILLVRPAALDTPEAELLAAEDPAPARRLEHPLTFVPTRRPRP